LNTSAIFEGLPCAYLPISTQVSSRYTAIMKEIPKKSQVRKDSNHEMTAIAMARAANAVMARWSRIPIAL